jgi:hypothetical protein
VPLVLIALADVGAGFQLEETLQRAGFGAKWQADAATQVRASQADVVLLDADALAHNLGAVADAWRNSSHFPAVIAIGQSVVAREQAPLAKVTLLAPKASTTTFTAAIHEAVRLRLTTSMSWPIARAALGLPPVDQDLRHTAMMLLASRSMDLEIPRAALRWQVASYVTGREFLTAMRDDRMLTVPELTVADLCDGTQTLQTVMKKSSNGPLAARLLWLLVSVGAMQLTSTVVDIGTPGRRLLAELLSHLRARKARLAGSTFYDVLEITPLADYPDIEVAYHLQGRRFAPQLLANYDLGELASSVQSQWDVVEKARSVLVDIASRGRYHDWLRENHGRLSTVYAIDPHIAQQGIDAFARGQTALGAGDVAKAMSEFAAACRAHSGHPDYEANLAWARFRLEVARGGDKQITGERERAHVEKLLLGCRPWPRALVALALLCAVCGDAASSRWYLSQALSVEPHMPAALQLLQRLSGKRPVTLGQ